MFGQNLSNLFPQRLDIFRGNCKSEEAVVIWLAREISCAVLSVLTYL